MKTKLFSLLLFCAMTFSLSAELTFSMIKPNAVQDNHIGDIIALIEKANLKVAGLKMQRLSKEQAEAFYAEHKGKPFYNDLVSMMSSGPIVLMVFDGDNAVLKLREVVGSTDPKKAAPNTIRALYGKSVGENSIHASDSVDSAKREIDFFFKKEELFNR